jgi:4-carboxymuconolactone decarboxylase
MTVSPRVPPLPREEWTDEAREVFGYWEGEEAKANGSRSNTMMVLAQHPKLAMASLDFGKYFMRDSTLSGRWQRMIVLRVAHLTGSFYQWAHNSVLAVKAGNLTEAEVSALKDRPEEGPWEAAEMAMLVAIDQLNATGKIDDAAWAALEQQLDRKQILDLVQATGYFTTVAWTIIAAGVQLEPGMG